MEHPIGTLPRTPFCLFEAFPLKGKREVWRGKTESHTLHVTFRSFPPLVVNAVSQSPECVLCHMAQKGKSRNVLASPLGEEGHEVAKGCTRVRSKNDTGRRLAVRIAMGCQIGALPCTPFASSRRSPQGETRSMERKNRESYTSRTISAFSPLVVNAVSQSPECLSCHMTQKGKSRNVLASPLGEEGHEVAKGWTVVR